MIHPGVHYYVCDVMLLLHTYYVYMCMYALWGRANINVIICIIYVCMCVYARICVCCVHVRDQYALTHTQIYTPDKQTT